jgi:cysteine synthase A
MVRRAGEIAAETGAFQTDQFNLVAALRVARRLGPGQRVVTVQVDSGLKYLAGGLYG